jgi:xanthine dehydrogenase large subunit
MDTTSFDKTKTEIDGPMHTSLRHDSAHKHVTGSAEYIDDMPEPAGLIHGALGMADRAHAEIVSIDLSEVEATPGVLWVMTGKDVPGENDISSGGRHDEPLLAETKVEFHGQPIFAVFAETRDIARKSARKAKITYKDLPHFTDIDTAIENGGALVIDPMTLKRGDAKLEMDVAPRRLTGTMRIGGQEHFYLEGHIAMAVPGEDDDVTVWSSTQHPSEIQHIVSHILQVPSNAVTVQVRRMGGGFGGKETQGNQVAAI